MRPFKPVLLFVPLAMLAASCGGGGTSAAPASAPESVAVTTAAAVEQPITRFVRVSGTLLAQEEAGVAAEIAGRIVATPIERGQRVAAGDTLIRVQSTEVDAQASEADANVAQIEARLGAAGDSIDIERVPEVANARAARDLARTEFERARQLKDNQLLSQSAFDQQRAQADAAQRQYEVARNGAEQQVQALRGARARATLARKAAADAVVRAPFPGMVGERLVSVGDYVTRGTKVATVVRVNPLRVELTVPQQFIGAMREGLPVTFDVDAYPGETFAGRVRYVSPVVKTDSRSLVVEAVVANEDGRLKPGFFAAARVEQAQPAPAVMAPTAAVRTVSGTSRVFVARDGAAEERVVTTGQIVGDATEITSGLKAGERVVVGGIERVADGSRLTDRK